jgi:hypothetical protein
MHMESRKVWKDTPVPFHYAVDITALLFFACLLVRYIMVSKEKSSRNDYIESAVKPNRFKFHRINKLTEHLMEEVEPKPEVTEENPEENVGVVTFIILILSKILTHKIPLLTKCTHWLLVFLVVVFGFQTFREYYDDKSHWTDVGWFFMWACIAAGADEVLNRVVIKHFKTHWNINFPKKIK